MLLRAYHIFLYLEVDAATSPSGLTALHLACMGGHVGVVGLLLSRSTALLRVSTLLVST